MRASARRHGALENLLRAAVGRSGARLAAAAGRGSGAQLVVGSLPGVFLAREVRLIFSL